jgi:hypothetical protein
MADTDEEQVVPAVCSQSTVGCGPSTSIMTLTWGQIVSLLMIRFLGDPGLVYYFMNILKPLQREIDCEIDRDFHCSLRVTEGDRLKMRQEGKYMYDCVPITVRVPMDIKMWLNSRDILKKILFFREGFMKKEIFPNGLSELVDQTVEDKIYCINKHMLSFGYPKLDDYIEAFQDYILFSERWEEDDPLELPYVLLNHDYDGQPIVTIIN